MKTHSHTLLIVSLLVAALCSSCGNEESLDYVGPQIMVEDPATSYGDCLIYQRHKDTPFKILAIGNSFTYNATSFLPWLIQQLNADSVCFAQLKQGGCSLSMHWDNHIKNASNYTFLYSDAGKWIEDDIATIDMALDILDWDIIVIQQASGLSGDYSSYNALPYLVQLFRETNPQAKIAWHYTWAYKEGTVHDDFPRYDNDPQKMYEAILDAGDKASEDLDLSIPSATLIWEMRRQYPEVEDQFSSDGYHISSDLASFALSSLWYECLIAPFTSVSCLDFDRLPTAIDAGDFTRAKEIIRQLMGQSSVGNE